MARRSRRWRRSDGGRIQQGVQSRVCRWLQGLRGAAPAWPIGAQTKAAGRPAATERMEQGMNDITEAWGQPFRYKQGVDVLPTWQQNQNLDSGQNLANWIDEGYSKNSLIYACIEEIATSFGELSPQLLLPGQDGLEEAEQHEVLDLLADPNESMGGYEFLATAVTPPRAAGTVYIHTG